MKGSLLTLMLFAVPAIAVMPSPGQAHENWRYEIGKRQSRHMELIREGRENGTLTWGEYRRLTSEQARISRLQRVYLADGHLDGNERQSLRYALDAAKEHIFSARNDADHRRRWW